MYTDIYFVVKVAAVESSLLYAQGSVVGKYSRVGGGVEIVGVQPVRCGTLRLPRANMISFHAVACPSNFPVNPDGGHHTPHVSRGLYHP